MITYACLGICSEFNIHNAVTLKANPDLPVVVVSVIDADCCSVSVLLVYIVVCMLWCRSVTVALDNIIKYQSK